MGLLVTISIIMLPQLALTSQTLVGFNLNFILLCFKELFIGFIQAFVFAFLVLLYIILALESHGAEEHEAHPAAAHAAQLEAPRAA